MEYAAQFFSAHPNLHVKGPLGASAVVQPSGNLLDDVSDSTRSHDAYVVSWRPRWRLAPDFDGILTVRPGSGGSMLAISATYQPPGGTIGWLFDAMIGRHIAATTIDHLLGELRSFMEERAREFAANCPSIAELNERGA
jgi:hypothetical protein